MAYGQVLVLIQKDREIKLHWCKKTSASNVDAGDFLEGNEWNLGENDWRVIKIFNDEEGAIMHELIGKFSPKTIQSLFNIHLP